MGAIGKYVAVLTNEERDRVIAAPVWIVGRLADGAGGGCIRGHAEGHAAIGDVVRSLELAMAARLGGCHEWRNPLYLAADRYNRAMKRRPEWTVRAIKLRAASLNNSDAQTIAALLAQPQSENVPA